MDIEFQNTVREQLAKLPSEVRDFFIASPWEETLDAITVQANIPQDIRGPLKTEVLFVLIGLVHPDALRGELTARFKLPAETIEVIANDVENKILGPIYFKLVNFFNDELARAEARGESPEEELITSPSPVSPKTQPFGSNEISVVQPETFTVPQTPSRTWEKVPEVIPENLPTEEVTESFLPNLAPKTTPEAPEVIPGEIHPFEEKMRRVFTGSTAEGSDLTLKTLAPVNTPPAQNLSGQVAPKQAQVFDPYREPIE